MKHKTFASHLHRCKWLVAALIPELIPPALHAQVGTQWVARYTIGGASDRVNAMVVDTRGNAYVTGRSGKFSSSGYEYATIKYDASGNERWARHHNGLGDDISNAVAVDSAGNVYVTGQSWEGTVNQYDFVTIKYDSAGSQKWVAGYNSPGNGSDAANAIAVDRWGNVCVTGGGGSRGLPDPQFEDCVTIKYSPEGIERWVRYYNGPDSYSDNGNAVAVDTAGNICVTGTSRNTIGGDVVTIKYDSAGTELWAGRYGLGGASYGAGLALDPQGNVFVAGQVFNAAGNACSYATIKYTAGGFREWARTYSGAQYNYAYAIAVNAKGNVCVTGESGGGTLTAADFATVQYSRTGTELWAKRYNGTANSDDLGFSVAVDTADNVYVAGESIETASSLSSMTAVKYDSLGNQQWASYYYGPDNFGGSARAIAVDKSHHVYVGGFSNASGTGDDFTIIKYRQFDIRIVDPNPTLLANDGTLLNDPEKAAKIATSRIGTVTDGISRLVLIAGSGNSLKFEIEGKSSSDVSDGSLSALGSSDTSSSSVSVSSYTTTAGEAVAIAIYTPPESYGNIPGNGRQITLVMTDLQNPGAGSNKFMILLKRPPVVLVHGLWSNPMLWVSGGFKDTLAFHGFHVFLADYSTASSATFDPTANSKPGITSVRLSILDALSDYHTQSIACAQADVVGHSMGGLMTRGLVQQPDYRQLTNYQRGWVRRFVTIGTPHLGSPLAKIIWDNRNLGVSLYSGESTTLGNLLASAGMPVDQGAIEGFIPGSTALSHLQQTLVRSHAIVATWAPGASASATTLQTILQIVTKDLSLDLNSVFGESDYDLIVGGTSEYGGLQKAAQFTSFFSSTTHAEFPPITAVAGEQTESSNPLIMQKVVSLLSSSAPDDFTDGFPQPLQKPIASPLISAGSYIGEVQKNLTGGLHITAPASGTVYDHHDSTTITISAEPTGGTSLLRTVILIEGIGGKVLPVASPYSTSFTLPRSAPIGNVRVVALALDSMNSLLADTSSIFIKAPTTLYGITVQPTQLALTSDNRSQQLLVLGAFNWSGATTIQLNITQGIRGTTYTPRHGYASVTPDGLVSAVTDGVDTLEVRNSVFAVLVGVEVSVGPTALPGVRALPAHYQVFQNYPNPFNPTTIIQYELPAKAHVNLTVYDILGRRVATLVNDFREAGRYHEVFNGQGLASGLYLYRLQAGKFESVKRMLVIK